MNRQIIINDSLPVEELDFQAIEPKYVRIKLVNIILSYLVLMAAALLILTGDFAYTLPVTIGVEVVLTMAMGVNIYLLPAIYRNKGYAMRDYDFSYKSGIIFPTVTTVPIRKIQQVSLRQPPVSRFFGLYSLDIVNGSQDMMKQLSIPGLSKERAEQMRSILIRKDTADGNI